MTKTRMINIEEKDPKMMTHVSCNSMFALTCSATCNIYTLKSLARVSAGGFEFFDTKVKSKWEEKIKRQLSKASQPGLTSVAVEWRQYDDNLPQPVQAPRCITALFNGTRQVVFGFVPNCTMVRMMSEDGIIIIIIIAYKDAIRDFLYNLITVCKLSPTRANHVQHIEHL